MTNLTARVFFALTFFLLCSSSGHAQSIFNRYTYSMRSPTHTSEIDRSIVGHKGQTETLSFRLSLYGAAASNMPLLVQVHEWGGSFARQEEMASYVPEAYDFVMLYFQYKPSTGNEDDWWFGTRWDGECHMWAHEAVMDIVDEVVRSSLISDELPGVTIDPDRVYLFGHSIGGTGAWQLGVRHPEVFAAIHAHSGFARFTPPVGPLQEQFENDIVGSSSDNVIITGEDRAAYPARDYSNLSWWLQNYRDASWETPFINITAGTGDTTVPLASGGDLMRPVLDAQRRGFFYFRHNGEHSDAAFVQMNWMWNFRRNQSFLAFTNRSGYGIANNATVDPWGSCTEYTCGGINDLYSFGWDPSSILDQTDHYEVRIEGTGTADVTLRRLQHFLVTPGGSYRYWLDDSQGTGALITADADGLLTVPAVSGSHLLVVEPEGSPGPVPSGVPDDGIWKSPDGSVNLYVQKYAAGSCAVVVLTAGLYAAFLDGDYSDGVSAENDVLGKGGSLTLQLSDSIHGLLIASIPGLGAITAQVSLAFPNE